MYVALLFEPREYCEGVSFCYAETLFWMGKTHFLPETNVKKSEKEEFNNPNKWKWDLFRRFYRTFDGISFIRNSSKNEIDRQMCYHACVRQALQHRTCVCVCARLQKCTNQQWRNSYTNCRIAFCFSRAFHEPHIRIRIFSIALYSRVSGFDSIKNVCRGDGCDDSAVYLYP